MVNRKLPENYEVEIYVDGFLHNRARSQSKLAYGYSTNHLPRTSGLSRIIESSYDVAKKADAAK